MRIKLIPLAILCGLMLGGCQGSGAVKSEAVQAVQAEAAKPALSEEAKQAVVKAEADIKEAKAKKALWTTAGDALKKAHEAAAKADSAATLKHAKAASEQAQLGIAQLSYPLAK
jgi:uncharacterized iron-regulated protein